MPLRRSILALGALFLATIHVAGLLVPRGFVCVHEEGATHLAIDAHERSPAPTGACEDAGIGGSLEDSPCTDWPVRLAIQAGSAWSHHGPHSTPAATPLSPWIGQEWDSLGAATGATVPAPPALARSDHHRALLAATVLRL